MLCLILCDILAPRRSEEKSFWAIKTFVFCSTLALHCSAADNKRDFHPQDHNISNQMAKHQGDTLFSLRSVFVFRGCEDAAKMTRDSLASIGVCWFRRAGHAALWLRPGKDTRHMSLVTLDTCHFVSNGMWTLHIFATSRVVLWCQIHTCVNDS